MAGTRRNSRSGGARTSLLFSWLLFVGIAWLAAGGATAADRVESSRISAAKVTVHFFDIGQGDASLIVTQDGKKILVDSGPPSAKSHLLGRLSELGVTALDAMVITHAHADHVGCAAAVLEAIPTRTVLDAGLEHPSSAYADMLAVIERQNIKYVQPRKGLTIKLGNHLKLEVLAPEDPMLRGTRSDPNANSIVFRAVVGDVTVLFTGDAEAETEHRLLAAGPKALKSDVLKVAHHGSRYATLDSFLAAVAPAGAVISCKEHNSYGHPAPETMARLERAGVVTFVTADVGEITFKSDGKKWSLEPSQLPNIAALGLPAPLDLNSANEASLRKLPGIGKVRAGRIIAARGATGGFDSLDGLSAAAALPAATAERIRPFVVFGPFTPVPAQAVAGVAHVSAIGVGGAPHDERLEHQHGASTGQCVGIDVNVATESELVGLPGIGAGKARAIVEHRATRGPFRSVDDLVQVSGIGVRTVEKFRDMACVSGVADQVASVAGPETMAMGAGAACSGIDINRAGESELVSIPGIGPVKARAIIDFRQQRGGFAHVDQLVQVHGIGAKTLEAMRPYVCASDPSVGWPTAPPGPMSPPTPGSGDATQRCSGIDINLASETELQTLPGIGPAKARAIVEHRQARGAFRSPDQIVEVKGIGAATLAKLRPLICVSGSGAVAPAGSAPAGSPGDGVAASPASAPSSPGGCVNINTASETELVTLPGIGPAKARAIVELRQARGGAFRSIDELGEVKGVGAKTLETLRPLVCLAAPAATPTPAPVPTPSPEDAPDE